MTKKGFTLVELMVVIIIMGLLAAVAVPKLSGLIAKSHATEIQPAAATYIKLQRAFINEKGGVGSWKKIGYAGPGRKTLTDGVSTYRTNYFSYGGSDLQVSSTIKPKFPETLGDDGKIGWVAENLSRLNDCAAGNKWVVKIYAVNDTTVEYRPESSFASSCAPLVSNWNQSDFGVTFGDGSSKIKAEDPPEDIPLSSSSVSSSSAEEADSDVLTAQACHNNGWLQGEKNGWNCHSKNEKDCESEKSVCFELRQKYFTEEKLSCIGHENEQKSEAQGIEVCNSFIYTAKGYAELFNNDEKVVCKNKSSVQTAHGKNTTKYCENNNWMNASACQSIGTDGGVEYCVQAGSSQQGESGDGESQDGESGTEESSSSVSKCDDTYSLNPTAESASAYFGEPVVCSSLANNGSCEKWRCASRCRSSTEEKKHGNETFNFCSSF